MEARLGHLQLSRCTRDSKTIVGHAGSSDIREGEQDRSRGNAYCLKLSYDGTRFGGWQLQRRDRKVITVQGEIERSLVKLTQLDRDELYVQASSRTDAGVHARGQVAHFYTGEKIIRDLKSLRTSLNRILPNDIVVLDVREAPRGFSARFHAQEKIYAYFVCNREEPDPFQRMYSLHVWKKLDVEEMQRAAALYVGRHDFSAFANHRENTPKRDPFRKIEHVKIEDKGGDIKIEIRGDGFLYKQVRNMVGALLSVGLGKMDKGSIRRALQEGESFRNGRLSPPPWNVAEPHGLFLEKVFYPGIFD